MVSQNDIVDRQVVEGCRARPPEDTRGRILQSVHTTCSETDARHKERADIDVLERTMVRGDIGLAKILEKRRSGRSMLLHMAGSQMAIEAVA